MTSTVPQSDTAVEQFLQTLADESPGIDADLSEAARRDVASDRWPAAAKWSDAEHASHLPGAVIRPVSTAEVSAVLRAATVTGTAVMPFGAGSGVVGGVTGVGRFVTLDLRGLVGEPEFHDDRGEVVVPAGVIGADLEARLRARGRRLPHYPQSLSLASVGGLVATRSSGTFSSKYGNIEDQLVALEVVLADGRVVETKATPRSSTGLNVAQLFVGSEGTLGVITRVTLRTYPVAAATKFRGVAFATVAEGITAIRQITDAGVVPAVIRLYDAAEAQHLFDRSGITSEDRALLILGFDGHRAVVDAEVDAALGLTGSNGGADLGPTPGETWERTRFDAGWLDRGNAGDTLFADAIEVAASWPDLAKLHERVLANLEPHVDRAYGHFSHFYPNGGAVYFIFFTSGPDGAVAKNRYDAAWQEALQTVTEFGGSISHHHGVGEARKDWMGVEHASALAVMSLVKRALDQHGVLAPGKLGLDEPSARAEGGAR